MGPVPNANQYGSIAVPSVPREGIVHPFWPHLSVFGSVGLSDVRGYDLSERYDAKFLLSRAHVMESLDRLRDAMVLQKAADGSATSHYKTEYWDTVDLSLFAEHARGRQRRLKVRKRFYRDTGDCFLEVKRKCRGRTEKVRTPSKMDGKLELQDDVGFLLSQGIDASLLHPTLSVEYDRVTLWSPDWTGRISIDTCLEVTDDTGADRFDNTVILEMKGDRKFHIRVMRLFPMPLNRYLTGFSKYAIGMMARRGMGASDGKELLGIYKSLVRIDNN